MIHMHQEKKRGVTAFALCDVIPLPAGVTIDDDDFVVIIVIKCLFCNLISQLTQEEKPASCELRTLLNFTN